MENKMDKKTKRLALAGLLSGVTLLLTLISLPLPSGYGYVNLGDGGVYLCAVLLSGILVSCSQPAGPEETTPSVLDTTVPEEDITTLPSNVDENGYLLDDLPELDYGKKEFTIFTWSNQTMWEWAETDTTTGDIIKDALFTRQAKTEDRLKVKIEIVKQPGEWENRNSFIDAVYNNTSAGINDDSFDLIGQYTPAMGIGAVRGCYTDLSEIKYLDL